MGRKNGKHQQRKVVLYDEYGNRFSCERENWRKCKEHKKLSMVNPTVGKIKKAYESFGSEFFDPKQNVKKARKYEKVPAVVKTGVVAAAGSAALFTPSALASAAFISTLSAFVTGLVTKAIQKQHLKKLANEGASKVKIANVNRKYALATIVSSAGVSFSVAASTGAGAANAIAATAIGAIVSVIFTSVIDRAFNKQPEGVYEQSLFPKAEAKINKFLYRRRKKVEAFFENKTGFRLEEGQTEMAAHVMKEGVSMVIDGDVMEEGISAVFDDITLEGVASSASGIQESIADVNVKPKKAKRLKRFKD